MAACTRHPTRPAPVPAGRVKGQKRRAEDTLEDKTEVLEEGELAAWFLNEMDQATQTEPVPYAPVDRPGVWMCPLHPEETLAEGRKDEFVYVYCPRDTCPVFSPQDRVDEWMTLVTQQLHEELRQRWDDLTCFCDRRLSLRKSGSEKNPQRMFLACRDGSCRCFLWLNLPLSGKMRRRVRGEDWSHSPLPRAKRECLAARMRGVDGSTTKGFMMADNGYNTLTSPGILEGLRYRPWMHGAWEEYQGASTPDARRQGVAVGVRSVRRGRRASSRESAGTERIARPLVGGETQSVARQRVHRRRAGAIELPGLLGPCLVATTPG